MAGLRIKSRSSVFSCLVFVWVSTFICLGQENEFFRENSKKFQRLETIHVIECRSSFGGNLVSIRIADKTRNKTLLASYRDRDLDCKTTSTFSSCLVDKDTRLLKVIVLDLAENETREYECNITRLTQTDTPITTSLSLNITRAPDVPRDADCQTHRKELRNEKAMATFPTRGVSNHQEMSSSMVNVFNSGFQNCGQCARDKVIIGIFVGAGALAIGAGVFVVSKKFLKKSNYEKPRRKRPEENVLYSVLQTGATASPPGVQSAGTLNNTSEEEDDPKYTELRDA